MSVRVNKQVEWQWNGVHSQSNIWKPFYKPFQNHFSIFVCCFFVFVVNFLTVIVTIYTFPASMSRNHSFGQWEMQKENSKKTLYEYQTLQKGIHYIRRIFITLLQFTMKFVSIVTYCTQDNFFPFLFHCFHRPASCRCICIHNYTHKRLKCIFKCFKLQWNKTRTFLHFYFENKEFSCWHLFCSTLK